MIFEEWWNDYVDKYHRKTPLDYLVDVKRVAYDAWMAGWDNSGSNGPVAPEEEEDELR